MGEVPFGWVYKIGKLLAYNRNKGNTVYGNILCSRSSPRAGHGAGLFFCALLMMRTLPKGSQPPLSSQTKCNTYAMRPYGKRRLVYAEGHGEIENGHRARKAGRGKRTRTSGPCLPKAVLYRAELFPDCGTELARGCSRFNPICDQCRRISVAKLSTIQR